MKPPILSILSITLTSFLGGLFIDSAVAFDGNQIDYKPLYKKANRSATLWKEEAQQFKETNMRLREMLEEMRASQGLASQPDREPTYEEFYIEIPDNGASTIGYYGGPNIKVNVWSKLGGVRGAILQIGADSLHKVYIPASGRALIYRNASGEEVYLTDAIASKEKLKLLVRRVKR